MPIASTDEQLALQASIREWAKRTAVIETVRGLEPGAGGNHGVATTLGNSPAAERWAGLAELGVFGIGPPAAAGGAGGSTADQAAALCLTIAGGTTQILLSLVAERQLGLPTDEVR